MLQILYWCDQDAVNLIIPKLRSGRAIAGSTDTVIGLISAITEEGFSTLNRIKGRHYKPYIILIESKKKINQWVFLDNMLHIENIIEQCWPGPVTLIVKARQDLPCFMRSPQGTIALRVPAHKGLQSLLHHFDGLFSTSANYAGESVPKTIHDIDLGIVENVAYIIDDKKHDILPLPSTILDCTERTIRVVREGAYSIELLERIHGSKFIR